MDISISRRLAPLVTFCLVRFLIEFLCIPELKAENLSTEDLNLPALPRVVSRDATSMPLSGPGFLGEWHDGALGLIDLRARYYDPSSGRFISMDTYEGNSLFPDTLHKYAYCQNDPISGIDPSGHENLMGVSAATTITTALHSMYDSVVTSAGFGLMDTVRGVQEGKSDDAILYDYWIDSAIGLAGGYVLGKGLQIADEVIQGGEIVIRGGVSRRLRAVLRDYWVRSGGVSVQQAKLAAASEGFGFEIGARGRYSRFENQRNQVVISKSDLVDGEVNRIMLAEEIQHGLDRPMTEVSRAIRRGLSNEEFHAEVFARILENTKRGLFRFLTTEDISALRQLVRELQ